MPLTAYTSKRPNAKRLKIFGCPIVVRHLDRKAKLDMNTSAGIFLGYTATDKNVVYRDSVTGHFKTATHVVFDEAGMTLPAAERSPAAKALQDLGYGNTPDDTTDVNADVTSQASTDDKPSPTYSTSMPSVTSDLHLQVKLLSVHGTLPVRATDGSAGYDVFSAVDKIIPPNTRCAIPLDIAITSPPGSYAQILSRSGLSLKHNVDVKAGVIDRDYTGNVQVILDNSSTTPFSIKIGDRIAQLVLLDIQTPPVLQVDELHTTVRGEKGFGSTGIAVTSATVPVSDATLKTDRELASAASMSPATIHNLNADSVSSPSMPATSDITAATVEKPYDIYFCTDPFDATMEVDVPIKGDHPTLGILSAYCDSRQRLQITDMAISTPGSRIKSWRTVLRKSYILKFNDFAVQTQEDLEHAIQQTRLRKMLKAKLIIATDKSYGVHPMEGILQIHFDQLNVIAKHLEDIKREEATHKMTNLPNPSTATIRVTDAEATMDPPPAPPPAMPPEDELAQSFTKKQLMKRADWPEWQQGIHKQLNQYWDQGMFSNPMPLPQNANALHMLWRYNLKACGTKKCRMVCNGSPRQKGTVTLGHTYANALDAASERLFWAIVANENLIAIGADVSNAFAEAPAPKAPLYLYIDDAFREWWTVHLRNEPIPADCNVVRVHNAIQGHPESPRLWEKHIDKILRELGMVPATHEPCLYSGYFQDTKVFSFVR